MNDRVTVLPENIRKNLAKFTEHQQLTCLECGYSGLMGVVRTKRKVMFGKLVWPMVIAFLVLSQYWWFMMHTESGQMAMMRHLSFPDDYPVMVGVDLMVEAIFGHTSGWVWVMAGALFVGLLVKQRVYFQCPHCEKELLKR